jgi:zinc transport system ATP-binding protein
METILNLRDVSFTYGHGDPVLDGVSFAVAPATFLALVGPNGAGKSTVVRVALGLLQPQSGTIELFGGAPSDPAVRSRLGYVPQRPFLGRDFPATVREVVAAGSTDQRWWRRPDPAQVDDALEMVELESLASARIGELSGGQQQRAFIAKALVRRPELLVLDEPVAGVDAEQQERFAATLGRLRDERGVAVVLVSHDLAAVESRLDRVIVLRRRVRFDGPPGELAARGVHLGTHGHDLPRWLEEIA